MFCAGVLDVNQVSLDDISSYSRGGVFALRRNMRKLKRKSDEEKDILRE